MNKAHLKNTACAGQPTEEWWEVQITSFLLSIPQKEVAEYLKLAEKTAYRLAAEGKLPGFKVGGSWRFKRRDIDQWISKEIRKRSGKNEAK